MDQRTATSLDIALEHHRAGRFREAEPVYRQVLERDPGNHRALHLLGTLLYQTRRMGPAEAALREALSLNPGHAAIHYHLANVLKDTGRAVEAISELERALAINSQFFDAHYLLGMLQIDRENYDPAEKALRQALAFQPAHAGCYYQLGKLLWNRRRKSDWPEAEAAFRMVVKLDPANVGAHVNLGGILHTQGKDAEAIQIYREALRLQPDHPTARHLLQSLEKERAETAAPEYVTGLFDPYAREFEGDLVDKLNYRVPQQLFDLVRANLPEDAAGLTILDLGCGTGLNGPLYRPLAARLEGCDLSIQMLEVAREKKVYDRLEGSDLQVFLARASQPVDLILSTDVFIYLGALEAVFEAVADKLAPGGLFALSIESSDHPDFQLKETGRFGHNPAYIERLSTAHQLAVVERQETVIRKGTQDSDVAGYLYVIGRALSPPPLSADSEGQPQ